MTIALLATGNEIIYGDTLNTNCQQIAHALNSEGLETGLHLSCSDSDNDILDCIQFLAQRHNIIIITGGLGPTSDDRTRFALGKFFKTPLVEFAEAIAHIQKRLNHSSLSAGNKQQALFPANAVLFPNPNGTAMGCYCRQDDKLVVLLPGPPRECMAMFNQYALPILQSGEHSNKQLLKWRVFGVAESEIAQRLDDALKNVDCETGYRLETPYVECKVRFEPQLLPVIMQIVEPILTPHIIATTGKKASENLYDAILYWQKPLTIIDEVTGGVLQSLIQRPANSGLVSFQEGKNTELLFHLQGLKEYWTGQAPGSTTSVSITYTSAKGSGNETHELPYRSPMVIHYAAEWLSFRLFHLINQLHQ
ncbi:MAG: competence/damage-inducible protein A [Legionella sp.]|nr:competence/damage-inducible protein A [Legionella sp.]